MNKFSDDFYEKYRIWKDENKDKCLICGKPRYKTEPICIDCRHAQRSIQDDIEQQIIDNNVFQDINSYILEAATEDLINKLIYTNEPTSEYDLLRIVAMAYMQKFYFFFDKLYYHIPINIYTVTRHKIHSNITIVTDKNPANKRCIDGHFVRSNAELTIDNWLYENQIIHAYEFVYKISYDKFYLPDFYLPQYDTYIEYFGLDNDSYNKKTNEKIDAYINDKKHNFIFLYAKDVNDIEDILKYRLKKLKIQS